MGSPNGATPPDTNYGPIYLIVIGIFTVFAVALCSARIWSRICTKSDIRFDDYLVGFATVRMPASCPKSHLANIMLVRS